MCENALFFRNNFIFQQIRVDANLKSAVNVERQVEQIQI